MKYIYLMRCGDSHYKVGIAKSVDNRLNALRTSNPEHISLVLCRLVEDAKHIESKVHKYLIDHRTDGGSEWFKLSPDQAIEVAIMINKQPEIKGVIESIDLRKLIDEQANAINDIHEKINFLAHKLGKSENRPKMNIVDKPKSKLPKQTVLDDAKRAIEVFVKRGKGSTSLLQRELNFGYSRAARVIDYLEMEKLITPADGVKPRQLI